MLSSEYFDMMLVCFRLFVGYCYDLDYSLIVDIGVSVVIVIFLGLNSVIKLVRCHRTRLFLVQQHLPLYGEALMGLLSCLSPVPLTREGYGRALP